MAGTKFAYVKRFELPDALLPGTFILVRLDGHAFHRLSQEHNFVKPNDERALKLMDHAALDVMHEFKDIVLAFGESDEYSFLFRKSTTIHNRRHAKILTTVASLFTSSYVFNWGNYIVDAPLKYPPTFDGRIVLYPSAREVRDYFSWRQADTHINNLYNTIFWALVNQGGETTTQANAILKGTVSKIKHEMLFSRFKINYNTLPERFRKGSVLVREIMSEEKVVLGSTGPLTGVHSKSQPTVDQTDKNHPEDVPSTAKRENKQKYHIYTAVELMHCDIIQDRFWEERPHLLED